MTTSELAIRKQVENMRLELNDWRFRMRAFRLFLCLEVTLIGFPFISSIESFDLLFDIGFFGLFSIILFFILLPFAVFSKSRVNSHITFLDDSIELPHWCFWVKKVDAKSISSIEEMKIRNKELGVLVGLRSGKILHFESDDFQFEEDFLHFKKAIELILERNDFFINKKKLNIQPIDWSQNALLLLILTMWLIVFFLLAYSLEMDFYESLELGALTKIVLFGDQLYRVATTFFLHLNNFHLSMNIVSLALFGQFLLRVVDLYRFLCILLLSAFCASIVTLLLSPYDAVIGASGGIMGVFGAYCCLKFRRYLPGSISSSSNAWILFFIAVQVALEYFVEGIDSYTHAGGFVTGFAYMWLCIKYEKEHSVFQSTSIEKVSACILTICYLGGLLLFFLKIYAG